MLRKLWLLGISFIALLFGNQVFAQGKLSFQDNEYLKKSTDTLVLMVDSPSNAKTDEERINQNGLVVKKLVDALKKPYSFNYGFDSLKNISFLRSADNSFRIITWYLPLDSGYKFYGTIQMNTANGQLKMFPLTDATDGFGDTNQIVPAKKWFGARYYEMAPVFSKGKPDYYILLGWKGNNQRTSKKVIDVLSFENGEPVFGKKIFETENKGILKNRVVFEYNRQNAMTLYYDKNTNQICFDHLAPFDPEMKGNFEFYGSDSTFDAYLINYYKFALKQDVDLKNAPNALDEEYVTPVKASTLLKKQ